VSILKILKELEKCEAEIKFKKNKKGLGERRNQVKAIQSTFDENDKDEEIKVLAIIEVAIFKH